MGKPLAGDDAATYTTAHGMGYTRFESAYKGIAATQTVFIPVEDDVELWDVRVTNTTDRARKITVGRSEEHTSELQSRGHLVCRLLLEKKKKEDEETRQ